jgi:hypothetical protein
MENDRRAERGPYLPMNKVRVQEKEAGQGVDRNV